MSYYIGYHKQNKVTMCQNIAFDGPNLEGELMFGVRTRAGAQVFAREHFRSTRTPDAPESPEAQDQSIEYIYIYIYIYLMCVVSGGAGWIYIVE